jgi:hypothetical protein
VYLGERKCSRKICHVVLRNDLGVCSDWCLCRLPAQTAQRGARDAHGIVTSPDGPDICPPFSVQPERLKCTVNVPEGNPVNVAVCVWPAPGTVSMLEGATNASGSP